MDQYPINHLYNFIHIPNHSLMVLSKTDFIDSSCHNLKTAVTCDCKDCPMFKLYKDEKYCKEHNITKEDIEYECIFNCRKKKSTLFKRFKITGKDKDSMSTYYTKNTIKLFLHYSCGKPSEEGLVGPFNIDRIATLLGVSDKTIRKQNKILENAGLIEFLQNTKNSYWVIIKDYKESHLSSKSGGKGGYLQISKEQVQDLMDTEEINVLRMKIQLYLWTLNRRTYKYPRTLEAIKNMLPSYINCKKKVVYILEKVVSSSFFHCKYNDSDETISYAIPEDCTYDSLKNQYKQSYKAAYKSYMDQYTTLVPMENGEVLPSYNFNCPEKEKSKLNTLIQLLDFKEFDLYINACVRYGMEFMDKALYRMSEFINNSSTYCIGDKLYDKTGKIIEHLSSYICYVANAIQG